ncbi:MAG TPA: tail fiber domain-containing protein [Pyrinomonadaceae bacterium]
MKTATTNRALNTLLILGMLCGSLSAQVKQKVTEVKSEQVITATATSERIRIAAPGSLVQLTVEVFDDNGTKIYSSDAHGGNLVDWKLKSSDGNRVTNGRYLSVITAKDLTGRVVRKFTEITVTADQSSLRSIKTSDLNPLQAQALGTVNDQTGDEVTMAIMNPAEPTSNTVVSNNGRNGQITRTQGALTFRVGDFFSGNDREQMRLTEDGRVGIGTTSPQATLDVAGVVKAEGIQFPDGTVQTGINSRKDKNGNIVQTASGSGTANQLAIWKDNNGLLGDSVITETGGRVGIGTATPTYKLVVGPDIGPGLTTSDITVSRGAGQSVSIYAGATGQHGMNFGWDEASQRAFVNAPTQSPITFTHNGTAERMRIATNGNVGIGTITPTTKLDVAGDINTIAHYNIFGTPVLSIDGVANVFTGAGAGSRNTGENNSFFGAAAGFSNTAGTRNSFFGSFAGAVIATGVDNAMFGYHAGRNATTDFNSFFGSSAGEADTSGGQNSFFGAGAGEQNTTGNENTFVGTSTGNHNLKGADNTFVGAFSGVSNLGSENSFFGEDSGEDNTTGNRNTYIGERAGSGSLTGSNNVAIGYDTIFSDNVSNSIALGYKATVATNISNSIAIGANVGVTTSHTIVLGTAAEVTHIPGYVIVDKGLELNPSVDGSGGETTLCLNAGHQIAICSSSLRYKKDLQPFTRGLSLLNQLQPITFKWKASNHLDLGFAAEDVARVEPLLAVHNDAGQIEGVKYDRITAVLVNAVKEQQEQINQQQQLITSLKSLVCRKNRHANVCK